MRHAPIPFSAALQKDHATIAHRPRHAELVLNKRDFLAATAAGLAILPASVHAAKAASSSRGPALLTVTGAIGRGNRGALDPALDQMMKKQGVTFDRAHAFDFAALDTLPSVSITPTLEYDGKPHMLSGPLVTEVVAAAGAVADDTTKLVLRAIDGYAVTVPMADVRKYRFIVATHLDRKPMPLGGLGPLWVVYEPDRFGDMMAKPIGERFAFCPWGLYHIDVQR